MIFSLGQGGCADDSPTEDKPKDAIQIGAVLPFSGPRASTGIQLERALMLAIEDVNEAGGVDGHPLALTVRDSNSGSERGEEAAVALLEDEQVSYLIGPEEDNIALELVRSVKKYDVLHIMPSFTSPTVTDSGRRGAWLQLAPSALTMACALATKALQEGAQSTRTFAARDDYHLEMASAFSSTLSTLGGVAYPTVSVSAGESSYKKAILQIDRYEADATLMLAYPGTAATIIKEMSRKEKVTWLFSPLLRDDALLWNLPEGTLDSAFGVSPSLSSNRECDVDSVSELGGQSSVLDCEADAATRFVEHYEKRWGSPPLKAAHYYYDAVVMLALGLEKAAASGLDRPQAQELLPYIIEHEDDAESIAWDSLEEGLQLAGETLPIWYQGAAGEYEFNARGQNTRAIVDTWTVDDGHAFEDRESVLCPLDLRQ